MTETAQPVMCKGIFSLFFYDWLLKIKIMFIFYLCNTGLKLFD